MAKKIKYKILAHSDRNVLEMSVQAMLNKGWELNGGLAAATNEGKIFKYQAMTKVEGKSVDKEDAE